MRIKFITAIPLLGLIVALPLGAADFTLKTAEQAPPKEVGASIRGLLQAKSVQLMEGDKPALEIWLRNETPLKSKPASASEALNAIGETTLVGVIAVRQTSLRDYKDNAVPHGVYTARFALQPKDGDHLGTAEFDSFLILTEAASDPDASGLSTYRALVKASGKSTSSGHPVVISLRPAPAEGTSPRLTDPADEHKAIRLKMAGKPAEGEKTDVVFDLVYKGHGHIQ